MGHTFRICFSHRFGIQILPIQWKDYAPLAGYSSDSRDMSSRLAFFRTSVNDSRTSTQGGRKRRDLDFLPYSSLHHPVSNTALSA